MGSFLERASPLRREGTRGLSRAEAGCLPFRAAPLQRRPWEPRGAAALSARRRPFLGAEPGPARVLAGEAGLASDSSRSSRGREEAGREAEGAGIPGRRKEDGGAGADGMELREATGPL